MVHIGENIRFLLKNKKKKQRDLAKFLKYTDQGIQAILKRKNFDSDLLLELSKFFDEPVYVFFQERIANFMSNGVKESKAVYNKGNNDQKNDDLIRENLMLKKEVKSLTALLQDKDERIAFLERS